MPQDPFEKHDEQPPHRAEFTARYQVESSVPIAKAAEVIAGEQSSGTFLAVPGETDALKARARARVTQVRLLDADELPRTPSLYSAFVARKGHDQGFYRGEIEIAFPVDNVGPNMPALLSTIAGNLFELGEITGMRLIDIGLPDDYAARFPGPQFGIHGTRDKAGVHGRPMIGTIIKPSIGLSPEQTAQIVDDLCAAGIDFIKDDELLVDPAYASFDARLAAVMPVIKKHAERLGRMPMYAINISGSIEEMLRRHDAVLAAGGTCVMASVNWVGFSGIQHLREHSQVPIHGHRNGWGAFTRCPQLGLSFEAYQKLWRLTGIDHLHVNGPRSKFWEPDDSVLASARACLTPFSGVAPIVPVFSSGQWAIQAAGIYNELRSVDLMHLAGGGIIGHPQGIAAGIDSMREGWEAAVQGIEINQFAKTHPALQAALDHF